MLHLPLLILFILQISSLELIFSSEYSQPKKLFINCGSKSNTALSNNRAFVGDESDPTLKPSHGKSKSVKDNNPSSNTPALYHTARVFQNPSSYSLEISQNGTYIVRLHFFAFSSSSFNLSEALFDVFTSQFSLLSNFSTITSSTATTLPVLEFLLTITQGTLGLYFVPSSNSSFAFVNAIEVFPTPDGFIPDSASQVASSGSNRNYSNLLSKVLKPVHRINVGGSKITPEKDTLWRTWIADDAYLIGSRASAYKTNTTSRIYYSYGNATQYIAPDYVYNTARFIDTSSSTEQANFSSIDWDFRVNEKVLQHLVRVHFCDIISSGHYLFTFNFFIYNKITRSINPYQEFPNLAAPFYYDFVVNSNGSKSINVSIGLTNDSDSPRAFLNGLEIFEIQNKSGPVLPIFQSQNKPRISLIIGSVLSCVAVVGVSLSAFLIFKHRKAKNKENSSFFLYRGSSSKQNSTIPKVPPNLSLKISFEEIREATRDFQEDLLIGEGGFGKVYKGTHKGLKVAVKRSKQGIHGQGFDEFKTEIIILSQIRHRHLVSLIGYCDESSEMILVYEFMENTTLRDHLHGSKGAEFPWEKRLEICIGAAKGLDYLHTEAANGILHRDVKSTNILLDENFMAKVADFGLSQSGISDPDNADMAVKGSFGYFDPEYFISSQYTEKSDVYSFGVVLLEVICGRPAIFDLSEEEQKVNLAQWGMAWQRKGQLESVVDPSLVGHIEANSLRVMGELAAKCLRERGSERPSMRKVVWNLEYALRYQRNAAMGGILEDTATNASLESAFPAIRGAADFPNVGDDHDLRSDVYGLSNHL